MHDFARRADRPACISAFRRMRWGQRDTIRLKKAQHDGQMRRAPHHSNRSRENHRGRKWRPVRALFICMCIRPIRCSRARSRLRALPSSRKRIASPRSRSPTPTTCSAHWNFPKRWRAPAFSRSSAVVLRSISATSSAIRAIPAHARKFPRLVLLAASEEGYRSLMRLNSRAFLETPSNEQSHLKFDWLDGRNATD